VLGCNHLPKQIVLPFVQIVLANVLRFSREGAGELPDERTDVAAPSSAASAC
jgi:hypothetical protein